MSRVGGCEMTGRIAWTSFAIVCLGVSSAAAQPQIATSAPQVPRYDLNVGLILGGTDVGDVTGPGFGLHVMAGRDVGPFVLSLDYAYHSVGDAQMDEQQRSGNVNRLGLTARYDVWEIGGVRLKGKIYTEAGAGRHIVSWNKGGTLSRFDAAVGFGVRQEGLVGPAHKLRKIGWYTGIRAHLARAPGTGQPATCDGPCDRMTGPSRRDLSMFWVFGINFGK